MNWIKQKTKKPANYMDRIRKSLGLEHARSAILGESPKNNDVSVPTKPNLSNKMSLSSSQGNQLNEIPNPAYETLDQSIVETVIVKDSPEQPKNVTQTKPNDPWEFQGSHSMKSIDPPRPQSNSRYSSKDQVSKKGNWDQKLKKIFEKQSRRVRPQTPPVQTKYKQEHSFVSIFDEVSVKMEEQKSLTVIPNSQKPPEDQEVGIVQLQAGAIATVKCKDDIEDQKVPEKPQDGTKLELVSDSQSECTTLSEHSRESLARRSSAVAIVQGTPLESLECKTGGVTPTLGMRASNSVDLIPATPTAIKTHSLLITIKPQVIPSKVTTSTPVAMTQTTDNAMKYEKPLTPQKRKPRMEDQLPTISLRYSSSFEQASPLCCSNKVKSIQTQSPKKKIRAIREEIKNHLKIKFTEIENYVDQVLEEYENELQSPDDQDFVGLFTPDGNDDPFDE